tara:strand:- start:1856 stop:3787 length:1932 start_codon:yes stop_codon:yes gene_type:complete
MTTTPETHVFEAEVREVLSLVIHSLYTERDIFLRELISNASDALDKLRFESLTHPELLPDGEPLGIALETDPDQRLLRIADNGIGMSREDLVKNLGSIASSGTRRFLDALKSGEAKADSPDLIGQFGVGFYSAFMVADEVVVETRAAGTDEGWRWSSKGDGEYTLEPAEGLNRGTLITLHLKEPGEDESDASQEWTVREIVRRYSDFVEYPIQMEVERSEPKLDEKGEPIEGQTEMVRSTETLNSQTPLWTRPKSEIEDTEYNEFYKHLTHDWNEPGDVLHLRAEGTLEYTALLYLPSQKPMDLFDPGKTGAHVSLYVRRVLIQKECEELLPTWLRFVRGVVECADLPLNVSRETLQDDPRVKQIQKHLVKKVLEKMTSKLGADRAAYEAMWESFGVVLKEGIWHGADEDGRIADACLFRSTHDEGWRTLAEYVEGMNEGQEAIYVLTGPDRATAAASPHLEAFRSKGLEVLLMVDPVDEWMLQRLQTYSDKPVQSIDRGDVDLDDEDTKKERADREETCKDLLSALGKSLEDHVESVRFSGRLTDSPAALVAGAGGMSGHMERLLKRSGQDVPSQKRVLEVNPDHPLVEGLKRLHGVDANSPRIGDYAELLFGQALLREGGAPVDTSRFTKLLTDLMVSSIG